MPAGSAVFYRSKDGDMVDQIVWRHYGRQSAGAVEAVLAANPGLADKGPVLEAGHRILLPDLPEPAARREVRLWG